MEKLIVRSTNLEALEKVGTIVYKAKFLNIVFLNTDLTLEQVSEIEGVISVERDDVFGTLCG